MSTYMKTLFAMLLAATLGLALVGCEAEGDSINGNNPGSRISDQDNDGIPDDEDNCPTVPNAGQSDIDGDGIGDACEDDTDGDGIPDDTDNCPLVPNVDQLDSNGDGIGDACTDDEDGDGIPDDTDNCPITPNPGQEDGDGDGVGDVCDNCPLVANPGQEDADANTIGDVCEDDDDGDGIPNDDDNCPVTPNPDQADVDADGVGDVCDNCPNTANDDQADADEDGTGDVCDVDGFTCTAGGPFEPLTAANFGATGETFGVCVGCGVVSPELVLDEMNGTFAEMNLALNVAGGTRLTVTENANTNFTGMVNIGFVTSNPNTGLLDLGVLGDFLTLRLYDDGVEVDSFTVGGGLLALDVAGLLGGPEQTFIGAEVDADATAFDAVALEFGGLVSADSEVRVHDTCVQQL